jgi:hypothetical protein
MLLFSPVLLNYPSSVSKQGNVGVSWIVSYTRSSYYSRASTQRAGSLLTAIRLVVPSVFRIMGPHSSKQIVSPSLIDGMLASPVDAGNWGMLWLMSSAAAAIAVVPE